MQEVQLQPVCGHCSEGVCLAHKKGKTPSLSKPMIISDHPGAIESPYIPTLRTVCTAEGQNQAICTGFRQRNIQDDHRDDQSGDLM